MKEDEDLLVGYKITYYKRGEIIGYLKFPTLKDAKDAINQEIYTEADDYELDKIILHQII